MRLPMIAGILLVVAGAFFFVRGGSFTSRREVMKVGDMTVSAEEQHPIRPWAAGAAVVVGAALLVAGARRKA